MPEVRLSSSAVRGGRQLPDPLNDAFSAVIGHLRDDHADGGIIGICGADGTGKTTLLETVRDVFCGSGSLDEPFDMVVHATVSRHDGIRRLQGDLGRRMRLFPCAKGAVGPSDTGENARKLSMTLKKMRFLLLLDDIQEELDLESVGIPVPLDPVKPSRIVFTTRSPSVCRGMGDHAMVELKPLDETQAWELFRREVGAGAVLDDPTIRPPANSVAAGRGALPLRREVGAGVVLDDPSILPLAKAVAAGCGALPLALVAVGRAMSAKSSTVDWEEASQQLQKYAITLEGENRVLLSALLFSYCCLRDDRLRSCLLYCSLFPEGHDIDREQLIQYWIGEGLLDDAGCDQSNNISVARERGHEILRSLQSSSLLERGCGDREKSVKLHPAVRELALWITSNRSELVGDKFLVHAGTELVRVPNVDEWEGRTRVSLMHNKMRSVACDLPESPKLSTLLACNNSSHKRSGRKLNNCKIVQLADNQFTFIQNSFFGSFPALRVLDLSHTPLDYLPPTVRLLCELRYLNLSHTSIGSLPKELGSLTKLRQLDLSHTEQLSVIPPEAFTGLKALQQLNLYGSRYLRHRGENNLRFLGCVEHLGELGISLGDLRHFGEIVRSPNFHPYSMASLELFQMNGLICANLHAAFDVCTRLRQLLFEGCPQLEEFTVDKNQLPHLKVLQFRHLPRLSNITLGDHRTNGRAAQDSLPSLSYLYITHCDKLVELEVTGDLPRLGEIHVFNCNAVKQLLTLGVSGREDDESNKDVSLPILSQMHLGYLSSLTSICGSSSIHLPSLKTVNVEQCPVLGRLPRDIAHCRLTYSQLDGLEGSEHGQEL